jgi:hypothetical protein
MVLTMILLAIKYNEDDVFSNEHYAKIAGISILEFNKLEAEAYFMMDFNLFIEDSFYKKYYGHLREY